MSHPLMILAFTIGRQRARLDDVWIAHRARPRRTGCHDRGEGVLSSAIAVLIFAFLGTLMWFGFKATFTHAQTQTDHQVEQIGN